MSSRVVTTLGSSFAPAEVVRLGTWFGSETSLPKDVKGVKSVCERGLETADVEDWLNDDPLASAADFAGFGWDDGGASRGDCALGAADP